MSGGRFTSGDTARPLPGELGDYFTLAQDGAGGDIACPDGVDTTLGIGISAAMPDAGSYNVVATCVCYLTLGASVPSALRLTLVVGLGTGTGSGGGDSIFDVDPVFLSGHVGLSTVQFAAVMGMEGNQGGTPVKLTNQGTIAVYLRCKPTGAAVTVLQTSVVGVRYLRRPD